MISSSLPLTIPGIIAPAKPDKPCRCCGQESYWLRPAGNLSSPVEWLCSRCHPDPTSLGVSSPSVKDEKGLSGAEQLLATENDFAGVGVGKTKKVAHSGPLFVQGSFGEKMGERGTAVPLLVRT